MNDVFDLLSELDIKFRYSKSAWQEVAKEVISWGCDPELGLFIGDEWPLDAAKIPLRNALEIELSIYAVRLEFTRRYPAMTKYRIAADLRALKRKAEELLNLMRRPGVGLYLLPWEGHRGGPKGMLLIMEKLLEVLSEREEWLTTSNPNEPYPGPAAPKDCEAPGEGFQWQHRSLSDDALPALITRILRIYTKISRRLPGTQHDGPAARFLQAVIRPVVELTEGELRYQLREVVRHSVPGETHSWEK